MFEYRVSANKRVATLSPNRLAVTAFQSIVLNVTHLIWVSPSLFPYRSLPPTDLFSQATTLPSSLTHLAFGPDFNLTVDHLPAALIFLKFGGGSFFNQPIDDSSLSLEHLELGGYHFEQPVNKLPPSHVSLSP